MSDLKLGRARPMSPHLTIYRLTMTMMMSMAHRVTGAALYLGTLLLAWFLIAASMNSATFAVASGFMHSWLGMLILFGFTWALMHHLLGGVRHALWDYGWGLDAPEREWLAIGTLAGGLGLTLVVWLIYGIWG
ncbi:MAG: succinate dehydrogenase, cytochrome b556 subunit [Hyphomicrobiales bacterium]|nr:succinate dehydrogenase, cytochrome b556 subunit [Hyphomicrobiales bacterium]